MKTGEKELGREGGKIYVYIFYVFPIFDIFVG